MYLSVQSNVSRQKPMMLREVASRDARESMINHTITRKKRRDGGGFETGKWVHSTSCQRVIP